MTRIDATRGLGAVLFDLDGTLIDTAPDFFHCVNILRQRRKLPELPLQESLQDKRHYVAHGSAMLIQKCFSIDTDHPEFEDLRQQYLALYKDNICRYSRLFTGMPQTLDYLTENNIAWGIVTNKPEIYTHALLAEINLAWQPHCVVCGDTTPNLKPHPEPVQHACRTLDVAPAACLFVGDSVHDMDAGKLAGTRTALARYGYIDPCEDTSDWRADFSLASAHDIRPLLESHFLPGC